MAVIFVTTGPWGTGKGSPLLAVEVDTNFYDLLQRIIAMETNPAQPVSIREITADPGSTSITIILTNDVEQGPFALPVVRFEWRGEWLNSMPYDANDIITREGLGVYYVLKSHTSPAAPAPFDPAAQEGGEDLYQQFFGVPDVLHYDIAINFLGALPGSSAKLGQFVCARPLRIIEDAPEAQSFLTDAPLAELIITVKKGTVTIGTITHNAGSQTGTFSFPADTDFVAGEVLSFYGPATADANAADWSLTIVANEI